MFFFPVKLFVWSMTTAIVKIFLHNFQLSLKPSLLQHLKEFLSARILLHAEIFGMINFCLDPTSSLVRVVLGPA